MLALSFFCLSLHFSPPPFTMLQCHRTFFGCPLRVRTLPMSLHIPSTTFSPRKSPIRSKLRSGHHYLYCFVASPPLLLHHGWPYQFGQSQQDRNCRTYLTFTPPPLLFYVHLQIKHNGVFGCKGSFGHASVQKVSGMGILAGSVRLR